ncbi:hypothetical protein [Salinibacter ruber]|uniref:hypothetical protein n=1 Tax=Salinibacter ruber TaxID=146919 RepID=UPI00216966C9|nr:hypothetical protein [Salinibacter ruber]MCS3638174.1 hypothetical protein [Salinibacter ruber]
MKIINIVNKQVCDKYLSELWVSRKLSIAEYCIWDINNIDNSGDIIESPKGRIKTLEEIVTINTESELREKIKKEKGQSVFFFLTSVEGQLRNRVVQAMGSCGASYCTKRLSGRPLVKDGPNLLDDVYFNLRKLTRLASSAVKSVIRYNPVFSFYATRRYRLSTREDFFTNNIHFLHNHNFDRFISHESKKTDPKSAVYVEQGLPSHKQIYNVSDKQRGQFWNNMRSVFEHFGRKGFDVTLCPHPNSPPKRNQWLSQFVTVEENTLDAISQASIVIGHFSSALDFAVLYGKPLCIVSMPLFESWCNGNKTVHVNTKRMAYNIGRKISIVGNNSVRRISVGIDKCKYREYIEKFISSNTANKKYSWRMIEDALKLYLQKK